MILATLGAEMPSRWLISAMVRLPPSPCRAIWSRQRSPYSSCEESFIYISPSCSRAASDIMVWFQGGLEHHLDVRFLHPGQGEHLLLHVPLQVVAHAAAGRGEGEVHGDLLAALGQGGDLALVDEPEVHDVDRDLGVEAGLELVPGELARGSCPRASASVGGAATSSPMASRVLALDADHVAVVGHRGVGAAQGLGDVDGGAGGERELVPVGDGRDLHVAGERAGFPLRSWLLRRGLALARGARPSACARAGRRT